MILNISRAVQFQECRQKSYNWHELRLTSVREANPLLMGGAFHKGVASFFAKGDVALAKKVAEDDFRERLKTQGGIILPEELAEIEKQIELSKRAVEKYADFYKKEEFQVIAPEVKFCVPLPNTHHHCWFAHRILQPDVPYDQCKAHPDSPRGCWMPHYFTGTTDGVINWKNMIWLLEHKTSAMTGNIFFDKYILDMQPTGYMYGIQQSAGFRPHGFVLNVIKKPNKRAADQFKVEFEREPFLRTDDDLARFGREFALMAEDYENAYKNKHIYMNTRSCMNFNRRCYYLGLCSKHQEDPGFEFRTRERDYVDLKYYEILGLPSPEPLVSTLVQLEQMEVPE